MIQNGINIATMKCLTQVKIIYMGYCGQMKSIINNENSDHKPLA